jgi:hypothetical protein
MTGALRVNAPVVSIARSFAPSLLGALAAALLGAGCNAAATTTAYTPITGLQISSSDVVAGHGCGTGAQQVYKYAAVVSSPTADGGTPAFRTSGVFDCFADGVFSNLPSLDGGNPTFVISIFAYDQASFPDALQCPANTAPCPGDDAGAVDPFAAAANWTATCTGTEIQGVTAAVTCTPLEPFDAGSSDADTTDEADEADATAEP